MELGNYLSICLNAADLNCSELSSTAGKATENTAAGRPWNRPHKVNWTTSNILTSRGLQRNRWSCYWKLCKYGAQRGLRSLAQNVLISVRGRKLPQCANILHLTQGVPESLFRFKSLMYAIHQYRISDCFPCDDHFFQNPFLLICYHNHFTLYSYGLRRGADKSLAFHICSPNKRIFLGRVKEVRTTKS
jgi:hypothetical protein